jgi:hypothetical protein
MKTIFLAIAVLILSSCTLDFRLKGYVYNYTVTQLEKEYLQEAQKRFGKMPATDVYSAGLKKYNKILKVEKKSVAENTAEFYVDKVILTPEFAALFLDFLTVQAKDFPERSSEQVLNEFLKENPEPWPTKNIKTLLSLGQEKGQWLVQSEVSQ